MSEAGPSPIGSKPPAASTSQEGGVAMDEAEWLACADPQRLLDLARRTASVRKLRLFAVGCCRQIWSRLTDADRRVVQAAEDFAEGLLDPNALLLVRRDARRAGANRASQPTVQAAWAAVAESAGASARDAQRHAFQQLWLEESGSREWDTPTKKQAARRRQGDLLREVFGNPFRPVSLPPSCLTPLVLSLAEAAYTERALPSGHLDPVRLAVLADALEESGCTEQAVLDHLRSPGPHVRGMWSLDLVLERE